MEDMMKSIVMAFNLGVWMKQQKGSAVGVLEAGKELRDMIYWNISQNQGNAYTEELVNANVEYFLQIALLGYILPEVALPDAELKNKLISLIEGKIGKEAQGSTEKYSEPVAYY
jgi:hypothetical protein